VDKLDELMKIYVQRIMERSATMVEHLNDDLAKENEDVAETEQSADHLAVVLIELQEELKITKRQRIRDILKHPEQEQLLQQTYDELEGELQKKIEGLNHQIDMLSDKRNTILQVNRTAKTALDVFQDILDKQALERNDLELIIKQIKVYEDHLEIQLQPDIDALLHAGVMEIASNFEAGTGNIEQATIVQRSQRRPDKVFRANVISGGDPLEIYTEKDGGVIFRKYSPMGDLQDFATQICESIGKNTGHIAAVSDRDSIIALFGAPKRELIDKPNSPELDKLMEQRKNYRYTPGETLIKASEGSDKYHLGVAAPILAQGDLLGCVMLLLDETETPFQESDQRLAQTVAGFLGKQMES
jgi:stage V sporulation protein T